MVASVVMSVDSREACPFGVTLWDLVDVGVVEADVVDRLNEPPGPRSRVPVHVPALRTLFGGPGRESSNCTLESTMHTVKSDIC